VREVVGNAGAWCAGGEGGGTWYMRRRKRTAKAAKAAQAKGKACTQWYTVRLAERAQRSAEPARGGRPGMSCRLRVGACVGTVTKVYECRTRQPTSRIGSNPYVNQHSERGGMKRGQVHKEGEGQKVRKAQEERQ